MKELIIKRESTVVIKKEDVDAVKLLACDASLAVVAQNLTLKRRTLESRLKKIKSELGLKTLHGLVGYFYENGLFNEK